MYHGRYWYTIVLWLTLVGQSEPVVEPYGEVIDGLDMTERINIIATESGKPSGEAIIVGAGQLGTY